MRKRVLYSALSALWLMSTVTWSADLQPFAATYGVVWRGLNAGTATVTLTQSAPGQWLYSSQLAAHGIFRLAMSGQATQRSELRLHEDHVQPLHYTAGGSERLKTQDLRFDWSASRVTGTAAGHSVDAPLEAGTQDDLSVQLALMHELNQGRTPSGFRIFNDRGLNEYEYRRVGEATIDTELGRLETVLYTSGRPGSERVTRYWCAPSLGNLPVRAQQKRGERIDWTMSIRKLER